MRRRKYITSASSLTAAIIAGCSENSDSSKPNQTDSSKPNQTNNSTSTETDDAEDHLETAVEAVQIAKDTISAERDKLSGLDADGSNSVDIRTSTATRQLDMASSELDTADLEANRSQRKTIDAVRNWISYGRALIEFLSLLSDGLAKFATGDTYMQSDRFNDASDAFQTANRTFADADNQLIIVRDRAESLRETDSEHFSNVDLSQQGIEGLHLDQLESALDAYIPLTSGMQDLMRGFDSFVSASTDLENERYSDAKDGYEAAIPHLVTAQNKFTDLESSAPNSLQSSIIELACYAGAVADASEHFAAGSEYYANGDTQAGKDEFEMGEEDRTRCDFE